MTTTSMTNDRRTHTVHYPRLKAPSVRKPHPTLPGQWTEVPLAPGVQLGYGPVGPYVVTDVRETETGVDVDLVAVVQL